MTNAQFIRSLSDEKLAEFLITVQDEQARVIYAMMGLYAEKLEFQEDNGRMLEWLRKEAEE